MSHILTPIGYVFNMCNENDKPGVIKSELSRIEILPEYTSGLLKIEQHNSLIVVFGLDRIDKIHLTETLRNGESCGIFACRSQYRPNKLGVTICQLMATDHNSITVYGLDAANGSPIYDIKCPDTSEEDVKIVHNEILLNNPRHDIEYAIRNNTHSSLIIKAGQLTGQITGSLALGVQVGVHAMRRLRELNYSIDNYQLSLYATGHIADGVIFVTSKTPGSGSLTFYPHQTIEKIVLASPRHTLTYCYRDVVEPHFVDIYLWERSRIADFFDIIEE